MCLRGMLYRQRRDANICGVCMWRIHVVNICGVYMWCIYVVCFDHIDVIYWPYIAIRPVRPQGRHLCVWRGAFASTFAGACEHICMHARTHACTCVCGGGGKGECTQIHTHTCAHEWFCSCAQGQQEVAQICGNKAAIMSWAECGSCSDANVRRRGWCSDGISMCLRLSMRESVHCKCSKVPYEMQVLLV